MWSELGLLFLDEVLGLCINIDRYLNIIELTLQEKLTEIIYYEFSIKQ